MHMKALWQKYVPDGKRLLHKCLPYALAVVLALATALTAVGQQAKEQGFANIGTATADLEAQKLSLQVQQQELAAAMDKAQTLLGQLDASNTDTQDLLEQAETQNGVVSEKIDELNSAYESVVNKEQQQWILPIRYKNYSSPYGYRSHPTQGEAKFHSGVDLAADRGTTIVAARGGIVKIAEYLENDAGYWVLIDHGDGYESAYMHMDKYLVTAGDYVRAGQLIGYCGDSGIATGCHLHFEIRNNNRTVNPAAYIDLY